MRKLLLLALSFLSIHASAQKQTARDTSFTIYSAYVKAKKAQPFISIAQPRLVGEIDSQLNITYLKRNGRRLKLDIFYPAVADTKSPAVLLIHGGGWRSGNKSQNYAMAKTLASNGFVAVTAEYRLSTEALYPAAVNDLKAAIHWMRKKSCKYKIDTGKIAVLGCSAGGQLAALLGTTGELQCFGENISSKYSSSVQAIVDIDGIMAFIHPESGEGDDSKSTSAATYWFGAGKAEKPDLWNEASALSHISKSTPPILFINSSVARMHAGRDDAIKKLKALNIYSEVRTFPDAPHPFWFFNPWFEPSMDYTITFLRKVFGIQAF